MFTFSSIQDSLDYLPRVATWALNGGGGGHIHIFVLGKFIRTSLPQSQLSERVLCKCLMSDKSSPRYQTRSNTVIVKLLRICISSDHVESKYNCLTTRNERKLFVSSFIISWNFVPMTIITSQGLIGRKPFPSLFLWYNNLVKIFSWQCVYRH